MRRLVLGSCLLAGAARGSQTEDLSFASAGMTLRGTLTWPDPPAAGARGAELPRGVLLVAGSGPNDRDEHIETYSPLRVIAESLTAAGFAVLRYDKRSCAPLNGHPSCYDNTGAMDAASLRIEDFRDDALAALAVLRARPEIRSSDLVVIGHSQGATPIAPMVCSDQLSVVSDCVLLMGHGVPIDALFVDQLTRAGESEQASAFHDKFTALRRIMSTSPAWQRSSSSSSSSSSKAADTSARQRAVAALNPMPDGQSDAFFWATWIQATGLPELRSLLTSFVGRGGRLLSINGPRDPNIPADAYDPLVAMVRDVGGTAVVMDGMVHVLAPTPLRRAAAAADTKPVCSNLLQGLSAWLGAPAASAAKPSGPRQGSAGWPAPTDAPCADAAPQCSAAQQAALSLLLVGDGTSGGCRRLFGLLLDPSSVVTAQSSGLCACWPETAVPSCADDACDCVIGDPALDPRITTTISAAAAVCAATPPPPPEHSSAGAAGEAFCPALGAATGLAAACQHGHCNERTQAMASASLSAAIESVNLDEALAAYPCTPCSYAVADLDSLSPEAEEALGASLKDRLAYRAAVVALGCGAGSQGLEYEMVFSLPALQLEGFHVGGKGALGERFGINARLGRVHDLARLIQRCAQGWSWSRSPPPLSSSAWAAAPPPSARPTPPPAPRLRPPRRAHMPAATARFAWRCSSSTQRGQPTSTPRAAASRRRWAPRCRPRPSPGCGRRTLAPSRRATASSK